MMSRQKNKKTKRQKEKIEKHKKTKTKRQKVKKKKNQKDQKTKIQKEKGKKTNKKVKITKSKKVLKGFKSSEGGGRAFCFPWLIFGHKNTVRVVVKIVFDNPHLSPHLSR